MHRILAKQAGLLSRVVSFGSTSRRWRRCPLLPLSMTRNVDGVSFATDVAALVNHEHHCTSSILSPLQEHRLQGMKKRHDEIMLEMSSAGKTSQQSVQELSGLTRAVSLWNERLALLEEQAVAQELLEQAAEDVEFQDELKDELARLTSGLAQLERRLVDASLPVDQDDTSSNAIVEVRAGTGGDEASLFASELVDCYTKTAQTLSNWKVEVLSETKTDIGGLREASFSVSGPPVSFPISSNSSSATDDIDGASSGSIDDDDDDDETSILLGPYGVFKFESGVHRVQRVPVNDSRIHTSACSVAVLPLQDDVSSSSSADQLLPMAELKIETMRASGAGGQHVNTTDSAVRITHIPTKITASIQDERSQHKNKQKALKLIAARVLDLQRREAEQERGETRSSLMGGGDRSERIRTYNFPQDRVTDHRSKETLHGIGTLLEGNNSSSSHAAASGGGLGSGGSIVTAFWPELRTMHRQEKLQQLDEQEQQQQKQKQ